ncbi:hypothetical protein SAMN05192570_0777 [Brevundimonas viscosa]|uniref:Uncharacterized protein n=2 Tax=Brevundimonas viscosa TaxID=871741 RepID=A0A1I6P2P5_9CAUL|nr:hypothetical protein SAMN05192570_0777 [Brevundimonas viscosa]
MGRKAPRRIPRQASSVAEAPRDRHKAVVRVAGAGPAPKENEMIAFKTAVRACLVAAVLSAAPVVAAAGPFIAADRTAAVPAQSRDGLNRRVRIHNQTGWTMTHFYASDARLDDWQEDMLGAGVLAAGASVMMNIDDGSGACLYDFRARFSNGQELTRFGVNVCEIADYYYTR